MNMRSCLGWIALSATVFVLGVCSVVAFTPEGSADVSAWRRSAFGSVCGAPAITGLSHLGWLKRKLAGGCEDTRAF